MEEWDYFDFDGLLTDDFENWAEVVFGPETPSVNRQETPVTYITSYAGDKLSPPVLRLEGTELKWDRDPRTDQIFFYLNGNYSEHFLEFNAYFADMRYFALPAGTYQITAIAKSWNDQIEDSDASAHVTWVSDGSALVFGTPQNLQVSGTWLSWDRVHAEHRVFYELWVDGNAYTGLGERTSINLAEWINLDGTDYHLQIKVREFFPVMQGSGLSGGVNVNINLPPLTEAPVLSVEGHRLTWNISEENRGLHIYTYPTLINGVWDYGSWVVVPSTYPFLDLRFMGHYHGEKSIKARIVDFDGQHSYSPMSGQVGYTHFTNDYPPMPVPQSVSIENGHMLHFNHWPGAHEYGIYINGNHRINLRPHDIPFNLRELHLPSGSYNIQVRTNYTWGLGHGSELSGGVTFNQNQPVLNNPVVHVNGSIITWELDNRATHLRVYMPQNHHFAWYDIPRNFPHFDLRFLDLHPGVYGLDYRAVDHNLHHASSHVPGHKINFGSAPFGSPDRKPGYMQNPGNIRIEGEHILRWEQIWPSRGYNLYTNGNFHDQLNEHANTIDLRHHHMTRGDWTIELTSREWWGVGLESPRGPNTTVIYQNRLNSLNSPHITVHDGHLLRWANYDRNACGIHIYVNGDNGNWMHHLPVDSPHFDLRFLRDHLEPGTYRITARLVSWNGQFAASVPSMAAVSYNVVAAHPTPSRFAAPSVSFYNNDGRHITWEHVPFAYEYTILVNGVERMSVWARDLHWQLPIDLRGSIMMSPSNWEVTVMARERMGIHTYSEPSAPVFYNNSHQPQLARPELHLDFEGGILRWDVCPNTTHIEIHSRLDVGPPDARVTINSRFHVERDARDPHFDLRVLNLPPINVQSGDYLGISAIAVDRSGNFAASQMSNSRGFSPAPWGHPEREPRRFDVPGSVRIEGHFLRWNHSPHARWYDVFVDGNHLVSTRNNNINLNMYLWPNPNGFNNIQVRARREWGIGYYSGFNQNNLSYNNSNLARLEAPTITRDGNRVMWNRPNNATHIRIEVWDAGYLRWDMVDIHEPFYDLRFLTDRPGNYRVSAVAVDNQNRNAWSLHSNPLNNTPLHGHHAPHLNAPHIWVDHHEPNTLRWNQVSGGRDYTIYANTATAHGVRIGSAGNNNPNHEFRINLPNIVEPGVSHIYVVADERYGIGWESGHSNHIRFETSNNVLPVPVITSGLTARNITWQHNPNATHYLVILNGSVRGSVEADAPFIDINYFNNLRDINNEVQLRATDASGRHAMSPRSVTVNYNRTGDMPHFPLPSNVTIGGSNGRMLNMNLPNGANHFAVYAGGRRVRTLHMSELPLDLMTLGLGDGAHSIQVRTADRFGVARDSGLTSNLTYTQTSVNITNAFTDDVFRAAVQQIIGKQVIMNTDVAHIQHLNLHYSDNHPNNGLRGLLGPNTPRMENVNGIEHFTALSDLDVGGNNMASLNVSSNTNLRWLRAWGNELTSINLTNNRELRGINLDGNSLTTLNLSQNPHLESVRVTYNNLTALDLTGKPRLNYVVAYHNNIGSINVTGSPLLEELHIFHNALQSINLSNNAFLRRVDVGGNNISSLDVSNNHRLEDLIAWGNNISTLTLPPNSALREIYVDGNRLTFLDVSNQPNLINVDAHYNMLSSVNLWNTPNLRYLSLRVNRLTSLDVSANSELRTLTVGSNLLTSLILPNDSKLEGLHAYQNRLSSLNLNNHPFLGSSENINLNWHAAVDLSHNFLTDVESVADLNTHPNLVLRIDHYDNNCGNFIFGEQRINTTGDNRIIARAADWHVTVDGTDVPIHAQIRHHQGDIIFVPLRAFLELLGAWEAVISAENDLQTVRVTNTGKGDLVFTNVAYIEHGRIYVPILSLVQQMGYTPEQYQHGGVYFIINPDPNEVCIASSFVGPTFRDSVQYILGKPWNDPIFKSDVEGITELNISWWEIENLAGIEHFTGLEVLQAFNNPISSVDLSQNTALRILGIGPSGFEAPPENFPRLSEIDLTNNVNLTHLSIPRNYITQLDVSNNTELVRIHVGWNNIESLDLSANTKLEELHLYDNEIETLLLPVHTVPDASPLLFLSVWANRLEALDISGNPNLRSLNVSGNNLPDRSAVIGLTANAELKENETFWFYPQNDTDITDDFTCSVFLERVLVDILRKPPTDRISAAEVMHVTEIRMSHAGITSLAGVQHFINLQVLEVFNNPIPSVDLSALTELREFGIGQSNQGVETPFMLLPELVYLTELDLSHNHQLTRLSVPRNNLTVLDLSNNPNLDRIHVGWNRIEHLNLSNNVMLRELHAYDNNMHTLTLPNVPAAQSRLQFVNARDNRLEAINLTNHPALTHLILNNNLFSALNLSQNPELRQLMVENNQFVTLDINDNPKMGSSGPHPTTPGETSRGWLSVSGNRLTQPNDVWGWQPNPHLLLSQSAGDGLNFIYGQQADGVTQRYLRIAAESPVHTFSGRTGQPAASVAVEMLNHGGWNVGANTVFTLTNAQGVPLQEVKISSVEINAWHIFGGPGGFFSGTFHNTCVNGSGTGAPVHHNNVLFSTDGRSVTLRNLSEETGKLPYMDIIINISAHPLFEGDVYVTVSGGGLDSNPLTADVDRTVKIAEVTVPINISTNTTEIRAGDMLHAAANITIAETGVAAIRSGQTINLSIGAAGIEFNPILASSVSTTGQIGVSHVSTLGGSHNITVQRSGPGSGNITLSNLSIDIGRDVPEGSYDLIIDGSFLTNTVQGAQARFDRFEFGGYVVPGYVSIVEAAFLSVPALQVVSGADTEVRIPVTIAGNKGIATARIAVTYDPDVMRPARFETGSVLTGLSVVSNLSYRENQVFFNVTTPTNRGGNGELAAFVFNLVDGAAPGVYPVEIEVLMLRTLVQNVQQDMPRRVQNGSVEILSINRRLGDLNGDGCIHADDATEILLYTVGRRTLTNVERMIADINGDNMVTAIDALLIQMIDAELIAHPDGPPSCMCGNSVRVTPPIAHGAQQSAVMPLSGTDDVKLSIDTMYSNIGQRVMIPVTIEDNSGFNTIQLEIVYDTGRLKPIQIIGGIVPLTTNWNPANNTWTGSTVMITGVHPGLTPLMDDGIIAFIEFEVIGTGADVIPLALNVHRFERLNPANPFLPPVSVNHTVKNGEIIIGTPPARVTVTGALDAMLPNEAATVRLMRDGTERLRATVQAGQAAFTFNDVTTGTYQLIIEKRLHAVVTVNFTVTDTNVNVGTVLLPFGKVAPGGGTVTRDDWQWLSNMLFQQNAQFDLDGDGIITQNDLAIILSDRNYMKPVILTLPIQQ
jgi:hypothetical protein